MKLEEIEELKYLLETDSLLKLNKEVTLCLRKRGVKLREFKWNEFEAS